MLKVCGITRAEDAAAARELGYDAFGMIFAESPRQVSPDLAREICSSLPSGILRVGVFGGGDVGYIHSVMEHCGLDLVQLHGEINPREVARFGSRAIMTLRPRAAGDLDMLEAYPGVFAVMIDTWDLSRMGGTGRTGDWELAAAAARRARVILAGGLRPGNLREAVSAVRPFGVDVSSGVESSPGVKDHALMRDFALEAKEALGAVTNEEDMNA